MSDILTGRPWAQAPWELVTADITAVAFRVCMAIQLHRRADGQAPFPSQTKLSEMCHVSVPTIKRAIQELKDAGILQATQRTRAGGQRSTNEYSLALPRDHERSTGDHGRSTVPGITGDPAEVEEKIFELDPGAKLHGRAAQALVAHYVDLCTAAGATAPKRVIGQTARHVRALLEEGHSPEHLAQALELLVERRLSPATLDSLMIEAQAGPRRRKRFGVGVTSEDMLRKAAETRRKEQVSEALRGRDGHGAAARGLPAAGA